VQFMATKNTVKPLTLWERFDQKSRFFNYFSIIFIPRVSHVEEQAVRNLIEKFSANKSRLMKEFLFNDPDKTGKKNKIITLKEQNRCFRYSLNLSLINFFFMAELHFLHERMQVNV